MINSIPAHLDTYVHTLKRCNLFWPLLFLVSCCRFYGERIKMVNVNTFFLSHLSYSLSSSCCMWRQMYFLNEILVRARCWCSCQFPWKQKTDHAQGEGSVSEWLHAAQHFDQEMAQRWSNFSLSKYSVFSPLFLCCVNNIVDTPGVRMEAQILLHFIHRFTFCLTPHKCLLLI